MRSFSREDYLGRPNVITIGGRRDKVRNKRCDNRTERMNLEVSSHRKKKERAEKKIH